MASLDTAEGAWLDAYGLLFGIPRFDLETDSAYRSRIFAEIQNPKGTPAAIKAAIEQAMPGITATVWDWTNVPSYESFLVRYDGSHNYDGSFTYGSYNYLGTFDHIFARFVVDLAGSSPDVSKAAAIIDRLRHAGMIPSLRVGTIGPPVNPTGFSAVYLP